MTGTYLSSCNLTVRLLLCDDLCWVGEGYTLPRQTVAKEQELDHIGDPIGFLDCFNVLGLSLAYIKELMHFVRVVT